MTPLSRLPNSLSIILRSINKFDIELVARVKLKAAELGTGRSQKLRTSHLTGHVISQARSQVMEKSQTSRVLKESAALLNASIVIRLVI